MENTRHIWYSEMTCGDQAKIDLYARKPDLLVMSSYEIFELNNLVNITNTIVTIMDFYFSGHPMIPIRK
jgi:hypothetical protein